MSKLRDLIERARSLLDRAPEPAPATDAVKHDRYDAQLFEELQEEAPMLRDLVDDLWQKVDYADDMVRDTLMQLWQGDPELREQEEMASSHAIHHAVAQDVANSEELKRARAYTMHDKYGAAMATIGITEEVRKYAATHADALKEAQDEVERKKEEAQEAQEALAEAAEAAQAAADAEGEGEPGEGEGGEEGDGGPAGMTLEQAIAAAEAAQAAAEDAADDLSNKTSAAKRAMQVPVTEGMNKAREDLEDEQESFAAWGVDEGVLSQMSFEQRRALAQSLNRGKLVRFSELVGRFKMMAAAQRVRKIEYGRDQVVGTELSGDLSRVVMTEFVSLAMGDDELAEMMEADFYRRWFEEQLISRKFEGQENVGKGAIICVWDESGSMVAGDGTCSRCGGTDVDHSYSDKHGKCNVAGCKGWATSREAWSKAFALALLDTARQQRRDFVGIGFASAYQQVVYHFKRGQASPQDVIDMVEHFFSGGTDFQAPMDEAIRILEQEFNEAGRAKGDIVFITDDDSMVTPAWLASYLKRKERLDFRTFGVAVGVEKPGGALAAMSDNVRGITAFTDPSAVRDVFQVV